MLTRRDVLRTGRDRHGTGDDSLLVAGAPGARGARQKNWWCGLHRSGATGGQDPAGAVLCLCQAGWHQRKRARLFHWVPARCCPKWSRRWRRKPNRYRLDRSQPGSSLSLAGAPPGGDRYRREDAASARCLYEACLRDVMYKGKAYTVPQSVKSLGPGHPPGYPRGRQSRARQDLGGVHRDLQEAARSRRG